MQDKYGLLDALHPMALKGAGASCAPLAQEAICFRLQGIQEFLDKKHSTFLTNLESNLKHDLENTVAQEEFLWFPKSGEQWSNLVTKVPNFFMLK